LVLLAGGGGGGGGGGTAALGTAEGNVPGGIVPFMLGMAPGVLGIEVVASRQSGRCGCTFTRRGSLVNFGLGNLLVLFGKSESMSIASPSIAPSTAGAGALFVL
jgi:hypothetical protein